MANCCNNAVPQQKVFLRKQACDATPARGVHKLPYVTVVTCQRRNHTLRRAGKEHTIRSTEEPDRIAELEQARCLQGI